MRFAIFAAMAGVLVVALCVPEAFDDLALLFGSEGWKLVQGDSYSYLRFPMVAGVVLLALGLKKTLEHVDDPLKAVPAVATLGGTAIYLLAHVAFRWRNVPLQRAAGALRGPPPGAGADGGGARPWWRGSRRWPRPWAAAGSSCRTSATAAPRCW